MMRCVVGLAVLMVLTGCGGGGGGSAPVATLQPLTTSTSAATPASITYSVSITGTSSVSGPLAPGNGTMAVAPCAPLTVGGLLSLCVETSISANQPWGSAVTRRYGVREDANNRFLVTGGRLNDGTTIEWSTPANDGPVVYAVGDSFTNAGTRTGFVLNTAIQRMQQTALSWSVDAIDDVMTPAGWFECYVVTRTITETDLSTGVTSTGVGTSFVRPEYGPVYSTLSVTASNGVETITSSWEVTATNIAP